LDKSLSEKFFSLVGEPDANGCRRWLGYLRSHGYGGLKFNGRTLSAHRVAWELANKADATGWCVCHACDVPLCVTPEHLFLGSIQDNTRDRDIKGRHVALPGEQHGNAKLKDEQVLEIRSLSDTMAAIAARFGISKSQVFNIKHRRAWAHLTQENAA